MSGSSKQGRSLRSILCGMGLVAVLGLTGCQIDVGGQTLPSAFYMHDDIQYFAPGPQFKLAREAAALRAAREEQDLMQQR